MTRLWKIAVLASLLCSGCTIGPRYQRPVAQTPAALKEMAGNDQWKMATPSDGLLKGKWWEIFGDPELNRLEELVNINNQNVKQAEAQFRQARAMVAANHANYYPSIGSTPAISQSYIGECERAGTSQSFSLPATATWEPDLWGRVRLSVENAREQRAGERGRSGKCPAKPAGAAGDRLLLAGGAGHAAKTCCSDTIEAYEKNLQLTINRHAGGVASRSDITLAQTQLAGAKAQSTEMHIARAQDEHAIAMLTGQPPASLEIGASKIAGPPPPIPIGVPSQLLERRPDIAASERQVAAANANIGIAETAYYPTLTLSASPGFLVDESGESVDLREPQLVRGAFALADAVRFRPPRSRVGGRRSRIRRNRRRLPADGSLRLSGSRGRSCQFALSRGRGGAGAGSRGSRPARR